MIFYNIYLNYRLSLCIFETQITLCLMKLKSFLFLLLITYLTYGQVGGEKVYIFLSVPVSARQASLGGKSLTSLDDINQPLWNPSIINKNLDNKFSINYVNFLADINYVSLSYARFFDKHFGSLYGNLTVVDNGKFIRANSDGTILGSFKSKDMIFNLGYSRNLPWTDFYIGANLKLIHSSIDNYSSNGFAVDISLSYYTDSKPFVVSAVLRNFGYQVSLFDENKEDLPLEVLLGFSYDLKDIPLRWYVTIDHLQRWKVAYENPSDVQNSLNSSSDNTKISFIGNSVRHFIIGAEFFPKGNFNIRLGYNFRRARELRLVERRTFSGLNFGFGLKMGRYKLHYAYSKYHPSSNSSTFSLDINLESKIR